MDQENNTIAEVNFAKNDDVSKEDHHFCLVERFPPHKDPTLTATIRQAQNHYQYLKQQRYQTNNELQLKKTERNQITSKLKLAGGINCRGSLKDVTNWAVWHKKGLQRLLEETSESENPRRLKHAETCSSVNELDYLIRKLHNKLQHGSNKRSEEKDLFGEIKKAEVTRQNLIAANKKGASIKEGRVHYIVQSIERLKREDVAFRTKLQQNRRHLAAVEKDIKRLEKKLTDLNVNKAQAFQRLLQLHKTTNTDFQTSTYHYR